MCCSLPEMVLKSACHSISKVIAESKGETRQCRSVCSHHTLLPGVFVCVLHCLGYAPSFLVKNTLHFLELQTVPARLSTGRC